MNNILERNGNLHCQVCGHPIYSDGPYPNKAMDKNGNEYIECSICHNKIYLNNVEMDAMFKSEKG